MMGGFFEWFLIVLGIAAVFNAEKLPALRVLLEEKLKDSLDAAKTGAQTAKAKMEEVKKDIDAKKNAPAKTAESEENTPEETEEALKFMSNFINEEENKKN